VFNGPEKVTKRELHVELTSEHLSEAGVAFKRLYAAVSTWVANRLSEGRPLELMLFLRLPGEFNQVADELLDQLFETPEIYSALKGRIVSVSIRSDDHPMPVRGGSMVLE